VIDPTKLPRYIDSHGNCAALWPHSALRTNTIFEVVKAAGGHTAWEDKHPAYDLVNGPSGTGVDDLYTPEITNVGGLDNTHSVVCTAANDALKVQGIINEIHGLTHDGKPGAGVPEVFGMNFQGVSVGQKLITDNYDGSCVIDAGGLNGQPGGYHDGAGTPSRVLAYALDQADAALAAMIQALKDENIYDSTLFIVTAKHGQSPINPVKANKPGHFADVVASLPDGKKNPSAIAITNANACASGPCGFVNDDDIALIWLADQTMGKQVKSLPQPERGPCIHRRSAGRRRTKTQVQRSANGQPDARPHCAPDLWHDLHDFDSEEYGARRLQLQRYECWTDRFEPQSATERGEKSGRDLAGSSNYPASAGNRSGSVEFSGCGEDQGAAWR
jgi:hypothetical protein